MKKLLILFYFAILVAANLLPLTMAQATADAANLIANPSVETADPANANSPQAWQVGGWGNNSASLTYPTTGEDGSRSLKVQISSYTSGDAKWYFNPVAISANSKYTFSDYYQADVASDIVAQFDNGAGAYTYQDLGAQAASAAWKSISVDFTAPASAKNVTIFHLINSVGWLTTDNFSLTTAAVAAEPTISLTAPTAGATLSGTVQLIANASAAAGVKSVQFKVDRANQGSAVINSPYQTSWDTTKLGNGSHTITALLTTADNKTVTSAGATVTVSNQAVGGNMVPNASLEIADPSTANQPQDWTSSSWGSNKTTFTYASKGHTGGRSVKVQMTKYTDGDAKWYFTPQNISTDTEYTYSDFYQSNIPSEVDVAFTMSDGSTVYEFIGNPAASSSWKQFTTYFSVPAGAVNATVYHLIHGVGTLSLDDVSMQKYTPVGFNRPLLTLTFDDSIASQYTNGLPLLQKYGFNATFYVITGDVGQPDYMTVADVQSLSAAGEEIGSHSVSHPDLTGLNSTQLKKELSQSQTQLQKWLGVPVTDFAAPYGLVNPTVNTQIKKYYHTNRGIESGFNDKNSFNPYNIRVQDVDVNTTTADINDWLKQAQATNTWLVLVYHAVDPDSQTVGQYDVLPSNLDSQLAAIKASSIVVKTLSQAMAEITPQLSP